MYAFYTFSDYNYTVRLLVLVMLTFTVSKSYITHHRAESAVKYALHTCYSYESTIIKKALMG